MDDLTQTRLIAAAIVGAIVGAILLSRFFDRRREGRFADLGRSLGVPVEREGEFLSRLRIGIEGRDFEVRRQHLGSSNPSSSGPGWCLLTTTALHGVSSLHAVDIRPRSDGRRRSLAKAEDYEVRDRGLALRDGWLTPDVLAALARFHESAVPVQELAIEEGRLLHRTRWDRLGRLDGPILRDVLARQAALASQLEQTLRSR